MKPLCILDEITRPMVLKGSQNMWYSGRFHAPEAVLSAMKYDYRLSLAFFNDHLGYTGALAFHIAGKSVGKQILAGAVKLQFLGNCSAA